MSVSEPISVTGLGAITALGRGAEALYQGLLSGRCALAPPKRIRADDLQPMPVGEVELDVAPDEDRSFALALAAATEAIEDAGWSPQQVSDARTLLVVATTKAGVGVGTSILEGSVPKSLVERSLLFMLGARLSDTLGHGGPVQTLSLACASGLAAVGFARSAIARGDVDRALVLGADAATAFVYRGFASLKALDPRGSRPFDATRAGLSVGEGAAAATLERGRQRLELCGYGASNDANHITGPARDGRGLVRALKQALEEAQRPLGEAALAVVHGTGTQYNDAMEGLAYAKVFDDPAFPAISIKGSIGHVLGAAGLANLVVSAKSLEAGRCPPSVGLKQPDSEIPLAMATEPRDLRGSYAVTSASGFAGVNAAAVLALPEAVASFFPRTSALPGPRAEREPNSTPATLTAMVDLHPDREQLIARLGVRAARRLDDLSLFGVAAFEAALGSAKLNAGAVEATQHGIVLGTGLGCLETDYAFWTRETEPELHPSSPRLFAYTLPNIVLGEVAIRHRLLGENIVLSAGRASGLYALVEAIRRIESGVWKVAIAMAVDAVGSATQQLVESTGRTPKPRAAAWVLEPARTAEARETPILGTLSGAIESCATGPIAAGAKVHVRGIEGFQAAYEPLGAAGVSEFFDLVRSRGSGTVRVTCPSGHLAEVAFAAPNT